MRSAHPVATRPGHPRLVDTSKDTFRSFARYAVNADQVRRIRELRDVSIL